MIDDHQAAIDRAFSIARLGRIDLTHHPILPAHGVDEVAQRFGLVRRLGVAFLLQTSVSSPLYDVRPHACASIFHASPRFENV